MRPSLGPARTYRLITVVAVALLAVAITSLTAIGFTRSALTQEMQQLTEVLDRINYVDYAAAKFDPGNQRTVQALTDAVARLDQAVTGLEGSGDAAAGQVTVRRNLTRLDEWTSALARASDDEARAKAYAGVIATSDSLSDLMGQRISAGQSRARTTQLLFLGAVALAACSLLAVAYLLWVLYLSIHAVLTWNASAIEALSRDCDEIPAFRGAGLRWTPAARMLVEQTAQIGADLSTRTEEQRRLAQDNADLSHRLQGTVQELMNSREEFARATRLAAVGRVAGGVSHEINNPVTGVLGYLAFIRRRSSDPDVIACADKATREVQRIGRIARSLLVFSRHNPEGRPRAFDVVPAVANVVSLVAPQLTEVGGSLGFDEPVAIPDVVGRVDEFQQCLMNLLLNARDAIEDSDRREVRVDVAHVRDRVEITVSDTGPGVPDALAEQVFEPFFTTKPAGRGSGLGLSVCTELMQAMQGQVRLDPSRGSGARFTLSLPTARAESTPTNPELGRQVVPSG